MVVTINDGCMWLAYRMSGFGGLAVCEPVHWITMTHPHLVFRGWWVKCECGWLARNVKTGELFATEADCQYRCDWLNRGNKFRHPIYIFS